MLHGIAQACRRRRQGIQSPRRIQTQRVQTLPRLPVHFVQPRQLQVPAVLQRIAQACCRRRQGIQSLRRIQTQRVQTLSRLPVHFIQPCQLQVPAVLHGIAQACRRRRQGIQSPRRIQTQRVQTLPRLPVHFVQPCQLPARTLTSPLFQQSKGGQPAEPEDKRLRPLAGRCHVAHVQLDPRIGAACSPRQTISHVVRQPAFVDGGQTLCQARQAVPIQGDIEQDEGPCTFSRIEADTRQRRLPIHHEPRHAAAVRLHLGRRMHCVAFHVSARCFAEIQRGTQRAGLDHRHRVPFVATAPRERCRVLAIRLQRPRGRIADRRISAPLTLELAEEGIECRIGRLPRRCQLPHLVVHVEQHRVQAGHRIHPISTQAAVQECIHLCGLCLAPATRQAESRQARAQRATPILHQRVVGHEDPFRIAAGLFCFEHVRQPQQARAMLGQAVAAAQGCSHLHRMAGNDHVTWLRLGVFEYLLPQRHQPAHARILDDGPPAPLRGQREHHIAQARAGIAHRRMAQPAGRQRTRVAPIHSQCREDLLVRSHHACILVIATRIVVRIGRKQMVAGFESQPRESPRHRRRAAAVHAENQQHQRTDFL